MKKFTIPEPIKGTYYSKYKDRVIQALIRNGGYCPCIPIKTEDTKCPCKYYRETLGCHCNLFVKN